MARTLIPRYLAALDVHSLDDQKIHEVTAAVELASKTSPLVLASPTIQATIAELVAGDGNLTAADQAVAADRAKLSVDIAGAAVVRSSVLATLRTLASQIAGVATSPADVQSTGFVPQPARARRGQVPPVPGTINGRAPRTGRGTMTVTVEETGPIHYQYVAEQSLDGVTWTQLGVGRGKTRVVTGASGAEVWVRFATVRGQNQSAWGTPTRVTLP
jgi:hypothetical protein